MLLPPPVRPTFDLPLETSAGEAVERLRRGLAADTCHPHQIRGPHVVLTVPPARRRFWSPYLTMEIQESGGAAFLHGRFSPKPAIWTGFMLAQLGLLTASFFAIMLGCSQALIGRTPSGAFLCVPLLGAAFAMYASSQIGQRLARDQMDDLRTLVCGILGASPALAAPPAVPAGEAGA